MAPPAKAGAVADPIPSGAAATPARASSGGYRLAGADGGVYAFGASWAGSWAGAPLVKPVVGIASTPRFGYWLVASDGGVASFGDAHFHGSTGGLRLNKPIVGMASTPSGGGYWLVASDGGVFSFGDAHFHGSTGGLRLNKPIVGMASTPSGGGYWLVASDGGLFSFGDAGFRGSTGSHVLPAPIVGMAVGASNTLDPYQPRSLGYDISWPQCGGPYPPKPHDVTIVGVNDGRMFTHNPCLASEAAWAGLSLTLYVNAGGLPNDATSGVHGPAYECAVSDLRCRSYNWGRASADFDVQGAQAAGAHASMWWLDVEFASSWRTDDLTANARAVQGLLDGLRAHGLLVGIYSTSYQFGFITGSGYSPGVPLWIPGARSQSEAPGFCSSSHTFGGGVAWLTQWTMTYDHDYACPV